MSPVPPPIRIAAALITDPGGRLLLVRKAGTPWFMQAGGKIEPGEAVLAALQRELREEIGLSFEEAEARPLGRFEAPAANEAGRRVEAELFHLRLAATPLAADPLPSAEIEEAIWVFPEEAERLPLAPLTRDCVLPLARSRRLAGGRGPDHSIRA